MNRQQHTPGPWRVFGVHIGPSQHFRAYTIEPNICSMSSSLAPEEVSANARLIAACPELLAALKALTINTQSYASPKVLSDARAAIATAEGVQP